MRRRRALTISFLFTVGCYSYQPQSSTSLAATSFHAAKARITMRDGRRIRMEQVYVRNDSLVTDRPFRTMPGAVSLSDVADLDVGKFSRTRTVLAALGVLGVAYVTLVVYALSTEGT